MVLDGSWGPYRGPGEVESPPVGLGGVEWTTQMSEKPTQKSVRGRVAHPADLEGSVFPPRGAGGVERPIRWSRRGFEAHPKVREGSRGYAGGSGAVGRPTQKSGRGREAHPEVWEGLGSPSEVQEGSRAPP